MTAVVGFLSAWLLYAEVYLHGGRRQVPWQDLSGQLGSVFFPEPTSRVYETRAEFAPIWHLPRPVDFRRFDVVFVTLGPRSSSGYSLGVERVVEERGRMVVVLRERAPRPGQRVRARVTSPYTLIAVPERGKPIRIDVAGRP